MTTISYGKGIARGLSGSAYLFLLFLASEKKVEMGNEWVLTEMKARI